MTVSVRPRRASLPALVKLLPSLVLLAGLGVTYLVWQSARSGDRQLLQGEFEYRVTEIVGNIKTRFQSHEQVLRGAAGLFNVAGTVSREAFRTYVEQLQLEQNFPGIQSIGFAAFIPAQEKDRHEDAVRREGFPAYAIRPPGERAVYTSLIYIEPFSGRNLRAFGLDMYAEPVRRAALERARDNNAFAISGSVTLAQETETNVQRGFLLYGPVYRTGAPRETLEQRRANLVGWVGTSFRMNNLMQGILRENFGEISAALDIEVYDGHAVTPEALMYDSSGSSETPGPRRPSLFQSVSHIELGGRPWTVAVYSLPAFESGLDGGKLRVIGVVGSTVSLLLALLIWQLANGRARAVQTADAMNQELIERKRTEEALRASEERWSFAVEGAGDGVWDWNPQTGEVQYSRRWKAMYLFDEDEIGNRLDEWEGRIHPEDLRHAQEVRQACVDGETESYAVEYRMQCKDGSWKWILSRGMVVSRDAVGTPLRVIGTHSDITEKKKNEELVRYQANYDALTGLPNRRLFRDRLQQELKKARRTGNSVALLFIDLDGFKEVNDRFGHAIGDLLLIESAQRIRACVREADTTARLGGDEFIVLVADLTDANDVERVAQAVVEVLAMPFRFGEATVAISGSVGVTLYPGDADDSDTLIRNADQAMYAAKQRGRARYRYFRTPSGGTREEPEDEPYRAAQRG